MSESSANNKRIAKNTLLLYIRMLLMMFISLFTSRIVLQSLGVNDYGIYNVVGGVVSMFSILSNILNAAIVRFISMELGKSDTSRLNTIFCTCVTTQILLIIIIVVLLESLGVWFLNYRMIIPSERIVAANWAFQFSVLTFIVNMWSIPYNSIIIAHEKMNTFAYVSILESIAKLSVAYLILLYSKDRLILYALLLAIVSIIIRIIYGIYCSKNFEECKFRLQTNKTLLKEMFRFAGWNFIGASSNIIREQGSNILLNLFFGPAINAAKGLALTVNAAVTGFSNNFLAAVNPQIYKSYAAGQKAYVMSLVFQSTRFAYYIILLISIPILITTPYLLEAWLNNVPEYTIIFVRLTIIFSMSESLAGPLLTLVYATGNIKRYQMTIGLLQIMNLPITYLLFYFSYPPESTYFVSILISIICEFFRMLILRNVSSFNISAFLKEVYINVLIVTFFVGLCSVFFIRILECNTFLQFLFVIILSFLITLNSIYFLGLNHNDRKVLRNFLFKAIKLNNKLR